MASQVRIILTVSLSTVMPRSFLPITSSAVAELPLFPVVLETSYQLLFETVILQLEAVQVDEVPVYVKVRYSTVHHCSTPSLFLYVYVLLPLFTVLDLVSTEDISIEI